MDQYGGEKKSKKTTKTTKTTKSTKDSTKPKTKKSTKNTKTRSKAKGGNFLGSVGDLVAPNGWGPFATAAGLLALDRVDAALRRGTKEKKEKMKGGECEKMPGQIDQILIGTINNNGVKSGNIFSYITNSNVDSLKKYHKLKQNFDWNNEKGSQNIVIKCNDEGRYYHEVNIKCNNEVKTYKHLPPKETSNKNKEQYFFRSFEEAKDHAEKPKVQKILIQLALNNVCKKTNS